MDHVDSIGHSNTPGILADGYEWDIWVNLPKVIVERARKYRERERSGVGSWCDGDQNNEGHFQGLEMQSILTDGVEVKLCKDCHRSIRMIHDDESKTFTVIFPDKTERYIKNIYTYWIDAELKILYLRDGNGEIVAAFNEWWGFVIKGTKGKL